MILHTNKSSEHDVNLRLHILKSDFNIHFLLAKIRHHLIKGEIHRINEVHFAISWHHAQRRHCGPKGLLHVLSLYKHTVHFILIKDYHILQIASLSCMIFCC